MRKTGTEQGQRDRHNNITGNQSRENGLHNIIDKNEYIQLY